MSEKPRSWLEHIERERSRQEAARQAREAIELAKSMGWRPGTQHPTGGRQQ